MTWSIALIAIAFIALSVFDLLALRSSIGDQSASEVRAQIDQQFKAQKIGIATPDQVLQQSLVMLEAAALEKRYHQANALNMSRILTKHLSFVTGAILALLGAVFILGKIAENPSHAGGGTPSWQFNFTSASPGIILAFFGTAIIVVSLWVQNTITVEDRPVYIYSVIIGPQNSQQIAPTPVPKPPDVLRGTDHK